MMDKRLEPLGFSNNLCQKFLLGYLQSGSSNIHLKHLSINLEEKGSDKSGSNLICHG